MFSYSSLLSLSPGPGDQIGGYADGGDHMAVTAAVSSYLSFDMDVGEEYYPPEAAAADAAFHSEQPAPAPLLASLQGTDDYKNGELSGTGGGDGESSNQSQLQMAVGVLSSAGLANHDKIDRRSTSGGASSLPRSKGSKIAFKTRSEVDVLDDGYRWRKYGKKMVKSSPNPRNYYRCSSEGCHVKKRVERERDDERFVVTTYDGVHNHPAPLPPQGQRVEQESLSKEGRSFLDMKPHAAVAGVFELLSSTKAKNTFLLRTSTSMDVDGSNLDSSEELTSLLVSSLLKRMGKIAMQMQDTQMKVVFNCFNMISSAVGAEVSLTYAVHLLDPLYKVSEGFAGKVISDEVKQLAEGVRDKLRDVIDVEKFAEVYNSVRKDLKRKRESRKQAYRSLLQPSTRRAMPRGSCASPKSTESTRGGR